MITFSGEVYEGHWKANKQHGMGRLIHIDGDVYTGEWENNMANGFGTYEHGDSSKYTGKWINDLQDDEKGIEVWPDGARYEGPYVKGKK